MMGFGGYGNGGSFMSPSSSNLSASAPPFTIDRSPKPGSVPLVDLLEPSYSGPMNSSLNNWLPSCIATSETNFFSNPNSELNSMSSPNNAYRFHGLQTAELSNLHTPHLSTIVSASADPFGYGQSADNVGKPYYSSYLSPTSLKDGPFVIPDQTSYDWSSPSRVAVSLDGSSTDYSQRSLDSKYGAQLSGGLWNGFAEWKQGKHTSFEGSFCSKETNGPVPSMYENYMNPEAHNPKGLNRGGEVSHGVNVVDMEKHGGSLNVEKLDGKAFLVKSSNIVPLDYSRSILGSISELSETRLESPALIFGSSSADHQLAYSGSNEQHVRQRANAPALVIGPPAFGSSSSAPGNDPFKNVNSGSDTSDKDLSSKAVSSIKNTHSQLISDHKRAFDSSQLRDDNVSLGSLLAKNNETSNRESITTDIFHHIPNAKSAHRIPNLSHDRFILDLNMNETVNSVQDPSEGVDHHNHAVDSPCWKGVPGTHSSPFDAAEVVPDSKKFDMYNSFNVQEKQIRRPATGDREVSFQKPNENTMYYEVGYQEDDLELPLNKSPDVNSVFGEQKLDDATEAGHPSETIGVQHSDDNHEHGSRSMGGSHIKNMKGAGQCVSSQLSIPLESVNDTKLHNSNESSSTPAIDVLGLVSTLHNLSELLLCHCTRGSNQLKQKDLVAVQNVIINLSACVSKNAEKMAPMQAPPSSEKDTLDYLAELSKFHEVFTAERPQATQTAGVIQALVDAQNLPERSKYYMSGKEDGMLDSLSVRTDVDMADEVKATKSLKKVLTENFNEEETQAQTLLYKNLWLEAEAALCSVTYKARYNRMKIEMENRKLLKSKDALENTITTTTLLAPNSNKVETLSPRVEDCLTTKSQELSGLSTSIQDDNVMARFQVLRCRIENSDSNSAAIMDKPSSSAVIPCSNNVDRVIPEAREEEASPEPEIFIKAPGNSSTNKDINDFDASVMARFHILKSRADNCNPPPSEVQPLVETYCTPPSTEVQPPVETYKPRFVSQRSNWPLIASISENREHGLQHDTPETAEGQLRGSGFHMSAVDDPLANSQLPGWYDRVPSDWEHVRKEDLGLHNR